jgi:hypothetical protein
MQRKSSAMQTSASFLAQRRGISLPYPPVPETCKQAAASVRADNGSGAGAARGESEQRLIERLRTFGIMGAGARPRGGPPEQLARCLRRPEHTVAALIAILYQI